MKVEIQKILVKEDSDQPGSVQASSIAADGNTEKLRNIWQQLLAIEAIEIDQNYFDLGGDSILAVQLFAEIEREFGVKLPVATLFDAPTIAQLARLLEGDSPVSGWTPLVPIQPNGSRPPFFCIHGAGGNVLIYRELAKNLGPDQPFFGLQSQGLDGELPVLQTVEEMSAVYAKEIRRVRPHGPFLLGGYCGGGTIALEVAQILRAAGEDVALLALFDTSNWCKISLPTGLSKLFLYWQRLVFHAAGVLALDRRGRSQFLGEKMNALRHRIPVWRGMLLGSSGKKSSTNASDSRRLGEIWKSNDRACTVYVPKPYPGVITDFRPKVQYRAFDKPNAKWEEIALGGQEVVTLPVYPAGMLVEPFVQQLAAALRSCIDKSMYQRNAA